LPTGRFKFLRLNLPRSSTIMFIPHSQQSILRMRVPMFLIVTVILSVIGITALVVYFSVQYLHMRENMAELRALRAINKQQDLKLKSLEADIQALQDKMHELMFLEKDVRGMLAGSEFSGRPGIAVFRESSRGGGRDMHVDARDFEGRRDLTDKHAPVRERKKDWDSLYLAAKMTAESLAVQMEDTKQGLSLLKKDVAERKAYLAARPWGLPTGGRISSRYGYRKSPFTGRYEFHTGLDIAAPYGAAVVATGHGKVIYTGYKSGYGRTVIIKHPYGFRTLYGHCSRIEVHIGQEVFRGDCIARVGSTGTSTGPHVHYEVYLNGVRTDPSRYLN